ncbi:MAG TPA: Crp/Fnr family transcriptional regulator [Pyrinomonadaceae bacterium]
MPERALTDNHILAALSEEEYQHLLSQAEQVSLRQQQILCSSGDPIKHLYFPLTAVFALVATMKDGSTVEVGVIGSEGMVGISAFWGVPVVPHQVVVLMPGEAIKMPAEALKKALDHDGGHLHDLLLRYTHALVAHISQTAACNQLHKLDARLARWLLVSHDRARSDEFPLTQEFIAQMMGIRRAGVTEAAGRLRQQGLLNYSRGHVAILDRQGLEAIACECYEIVRQAFDYYLRSVTPHPARQMALSVEQFADRGSKVSERIGTSLPSYRRKG